MVWPAHSAGEILFNVGQFHFQGFPPLPCPLLGNANDFSFPSTSSSFPFKLIHMEV